MTTVTHGSFASPLSLIAEWQALPGGPPLRELVVLGYTLDLPLLERFAIPQARQLGARVTVLADAGHGVFDAVDVRFAGRVYQHGTAALAGAFHPKLALLVGDDLVWAAVGSGNPTLSGWGHNHELWCVVRGSRERGAQVQADLGRWLDRLPTAVPMPSWIDRTLREVGAAILPSTLDTAHRDVRLLHNLDRPIIDQLDLGQVEELRLAAPFVDPSGDAVRALLARSSPRRLRFALQRNWSSINGQQLLGAVRGVGDVAFTGVEEARTLHGKLIEWTAPDGSLVAVVGSPNLTAAALCGTVGAGHNCELAVRAPVRDSLFPEGRPLSTADVAATAWRRSEEVGEAGHGLRLLGCRRGDEGLLVELVCRHTVEVAIETSGDGSPGSWEPRATIPGPAIRTAAVTSVPFVAPDVPGVRVRVAATIHGVRVESAPVFVTDPVRCRARTDDGGGPRQHQQGPVDEVLADSALAQQFSTNLLRLIEHSAQQRVSAAPRTGAAASVSREAGDRWERFLDVAERSLGRGLATLVYPGARSSPAAEQTGSGWVLADVVDHSELAEGESDEVLDDEEQFAPPPPRVPPSEHGRQRTWLARWVAAVHPHDATARPDLNLRVVVAALYVNRLAAGIWGAADGWRSELADLVEALTADSAAVSGEPAQLEDYLDAWVAVCLALLLQDATLHGGSEADIVARRAWEAGCLHAAAAEEPIVESLLDALKDSTLPYARVTTVAEVLGAIALAQKDVEDPFTSVLAGFAAAGFDVDRRDGAWIARGSFRRAARAAGQVLTDVASGDSVVVATNGATSAIMARVGREILVAESTVRTWRRFGPRPMRTPASLFGDGEAAPRPDRTHPLLPLPGDLVQLGAALQVDIGALVEEFLPRPRRAGAW